MYLLKDSFLRSILCMLMSTAWGQEAHIAEVDTFDYVFLSADRPHQLAAQFLTEIEQRSVNPIAFLDYMEAKRGPRDSLSYGVGDMRVERPVRILLVVFLLFLAVALVGL